MSREVKTMFGTSLESLDFWGMKLLIFGAVAGGIGLAASLAAALLSSHVTKRVQADANQRIEVARADAAQANAAAEGARADAARANVATEELRARNIEFEKAIAPRVLEQNLTAKELAKFVGFSYLVAMPSDFEPRRMAGQLRVMLNQAGWKLDPNIVPRKYTFWDGVFVHTAVGAIAPEAAEAGSALVEILNANGVEARSGYPMKTLKQNEVFIIVGPKPLPESLRVNPEDIPADEHGNRIFGSTTE